MARILLFGAYNINYVPGEVVGWLQEYSRQGHEFITGDGKILDEAFHKTLSSIGATNVTIYAMDNARNNLFEFRVKKFLTSFNSESKTVAISASDDSMLPYVICDVEKEQDIPLNREWYEFRDKQLIRDCDMAICIYDGENKTAAHMIQLLNIYNKPCYTFNVG
jgi:hypothetical protein